MIKEKNTEEIAEYKLCQKDMYIEKPSSTQVGTLARKGAFWSILLIGGRQIFSLGFTTVLARILSPEDYGLIGMVSTLTALMLVFSEMGLSTATIQTKNLTQAQVYNLFWINIFIGLILWGICYLISPSIASFYKKRELVDITIVLGSNFLISGISVQPLALLKRKMDFQSITIIELSSLILGGVSGIFFAISGYGYWSLVFQTLIVSFVRLVLALIFSKFLPSLPRRGVGTYRLVNFGGLLALNGLCIYFSRNVDSVLIGKFWGVAELGYYDRAYFLMMLPSMIATSVLSQLMVPSLSALQDDRERFGKAYRKSIRMVAFIGCPIAAGLAIVAPEMVLLIYGEQWAPVVPILIWLSIASITQPIYNTNGWLFTASGKAKSYLAVTVTNAIVLIGTFIFTIKGGAVGIAIGYAIAMGLFLPWPTLYLAHQAANLRVRDTYRILIPVLSVTAIMSIIALMCGFLAKEINLIWWNILIIKIFSGIMSFIIMTWFFLKQMLIEDFEKFLPKRIYNKLNNKNL
ncbi:lipopolysaccharide biosynthesis protein [Methylobacter sp. Wu1]|uniref:lipopolysaccharide biosynthesis protein n=1 Tax=Methylobacter sp. Wu1 TaxID=3119359 RepID=UPI002F95D58B